MRVFCVNIPRFVASHIGAIYETAWSITHGKIFMELLNELHESVKKPFSLEIYSARGTVYFCISGESSAVELLSSGIYSLFDGYEIREIADYTEDIDDSTIVASTSLYLAKPDVVPLQNFRDFGFNTMATTCQPLTAIPTTDRILLQLVICPTRDTAVLHSKLFSQRAEAAFWREVKPETWCKRDLKTEFYTKMRTKSTLKFFNVTYRIASFTKRPLDASPEEVENIKKRLGRHLNLAVGVLMCVNTHNENKLLPRPFRYGASYIKPFHERLLQRPVLLTGDELSTLWHLPRLFMVPYTAQVLSKKCAPPKGLPNNDTDGQVTLFGATNYRDEATPFGIRRFDRRRHYYVIGKSGSGKSCLLQLLVKADIEQGFGCAVLDPHGDLVDDILPLIPKHRIKDVVIFDPSDTAYPPSFNPLTALKPELRMRATLSFIEVFRKILGSDWSERIDHVIRYAMLALLSIPGSSIVSFRRFLTDESYRSAVLKHLTDEQVLRFWNEEFSARKAEFEEGPIARLLNRLDHLLATDMVRNIIGQPQNLFNFRELMDSRKIVLIKVSKGILGAENAAFLGSLIISKIYEAAMSRADIPQEQRDDFYFYIDEFQNFATESFGEMLSESRKYRLCLTFANQYLGQLPSSVSEVVFGNVGNILSFRVGGSDATKLSAEFKPRVMPADIINLGDREFYLKMSIDGEVQEAFSGKTLDLIRPPYGEDCVRECIQHSRAHYALPLRHALESIEISEFGVYASKINLSDDALA